MRKKIFLWLGREFITLSCEGKEGMKATDQSREIFRSLDEELRGMGLSLENTVRTRLWGRDGQSRTLGSDERVRVLSGKARSASSSFIAPDHFDSNAHVALDLLAMRPLHPELEKTLVEYDPPITPLRYLVYDSLAFLSGVTAVLPTLDDQMADILSRISTSLTNAGSSWDKAVRVSFFLHRSQALQALKDLFKKTVKADIPQMEYSFVDGYSREGKLIEIEVSAETTK